MQAIQTPPRADRPRSGPFGTLLPYGEVFVAAAILLTVVLTS